MIKLDYMYFSLKECNDDFFSDLSALSVKIIYAITIRLYQNTLSSDTCVIA